MKIVKPKITNITKKDIKSCFATQEFFEAELENETPTKSTNSTKIRLLSRHSSGRFAAKRGASEREWSIRGRISGRTSLF